MQKADLHDPRFLEGHWLAPLFLTIVRRHVDGYAQHNLVDSTYVHMYYYNILLLVIIINYITHHILQLVIYSFHLNIKYTS